jgi:protein-S-isoprenylcysteine O-methyltransferase Ste14
MAVPREAGLGGKVGGRLVSILFRVIPASYFTLACVAFWKSFQATGKWTSLFWMVSEGVVVVLFVFRRPSTSISRSPWDWISGVAGSFLVLLVRPESRAVAPDAVGFTLQLCGTLFQLYGKIALGRSFGVVAANRGVVVGGPYRLVRHPIYLGYLVTHAGFLLSNWSLRNMSIYFASYVFQIARIFAEERILLDDGRYREYFRSVRYRLIPGLF